MHSILSPPFAMRLLPLGLFFLDATLSHSEKCPKAKNGGLLLCVETANPNCYRFYMCLSNSLESSQRYGTIGGAFQQNCFFLLGMFVHFLSTPYVQKEDGRVWYLGEGNFGAGMIERKSRYKNHSTFAIIVCFCNELLGGGFKYLLFSPLLGAMIQFD